MIWCAQAVKRIMDRNGLSEEEAEKRLAAQRTNAERLDDTDVILSPLWEREDTFQHQVGAGLWVPASLMWT